MEPLGGHDMGLDQRVQRRQRRGDRADLVGERRQAELDAFAGVALGLAVERLMLAVLLEDDHRQKARAGPAARRGVEGRRRLADALAVATAELLADGLDHLPPAGDHLERLGDVLAHLGQPRRAAGGAVAGRGQHDALARQMFGERLADRLAPLEGADRGLGLLRRRGGERLVLGGGGLHLLELEFELIEQPLLALGALAVEFSPELLDLELQMRDQRLATRDQRLGVSRRRLGLGGLPRRWRRPAPRPRRGRRAGPRSRRRRPSCREVYRMESET
jgi:hypothetical protein